MFISANEHLFNACMQNDFNKVKHYLTSTKIKELADINYFHNHGFTAGVSVLMIACAFSDVNIVQYLLTSNELQTHANINEVDEDGNSPLIWASYQGKIDTVKYLLTSPELKEHANIHQVNNAGHDALAYACVHGQGEIIKYLLTGTDLQEQAIPDFENPVVLQACMEDLSIAHHLFVIKGYQIEDKLMSLIKKYTKYAPLMQFLERQELNERLNSNLDIKYNPKQRKI